MVEVVVTEVVGEDEGVVVDMEEVEMERKYMFCSRQEGLIKDDEKCDLT